MFSKFIYLEVIQGYGNIKPGNIKIQQAGHGTFKFIQSIWLRPAQYYIEDICWEQSDDRNPGKVIAGSVIGGMAAGPLGLIAGSLIGSKKKDTSTAVIVIDTDQGSAQIKVKCNAKQFQYLVSMKN